MANMLELNVQNGKEPFFIMKKNSSVLYCWQFVVFASVSHYLMLVSMVAITIPGCYVTPVLISSLFFLYEMKYF